MRAARLWVAVLASGLAFGTVASAQPEPPSAPAPVPEPVAAPAPAPVPAPAPELPPAPAPAAEPPPAPAPERAPDALLLVWKSRVMTGFELTRERPSGEQLGQDETDYGFFLDQARLELEAEFGRLSSEVSLDLADAIRPKDVQDLDAPPYIRDAFVNLRIKKAFRVRAGRFKRPYSRLELTSSGVLPIRGRGLLNELIVEDARWGGRELGLMLWGRLPADLSWFASASNPDWAPDGDQEANGVDAHARVVWDATPLLSIGLNGGHKLAVQAGQDLSTNAGGVDLELRNDRLWVLLDALLAEIPTAMPERPTALAYGAVVFASYDLPISRTLTLSPVLSAEYADADADYSGSSALRAIAGLTLRYGDLLRVMPQVELVRPLGTASAELPWRASEAYYVMLAAQL